MKSIGGDELEELVVGSSLCIYADYFLPVIFKTRNYTESYFHQGSTDSNLSREMTY